MPDYIAQYRIYLEQEKHASANTVSSYIRDVTQFCAWLPEGSDLRRVKPAAVSDYLTYLTDRGRSAATVIRSAASIKSFYNYLVVSDAMKANPAKGIAAAKAERKCPQILTGREVELLLEQPKCVDEKGFRDRAMLELLYATGIRVSECVGINIDDLDFQTNGVLVTRKGGNQVILYYPQEVADALADYLKERKTMEPATPEDQNALFLSLQRKRITQRAVQKMVKKYCALAVPLKKRMSPHKLRSTYATRLYHETEDIYLVAEALGHSDVNTTRKHYAAMSDQRRREAAQNTHLPTNEK